MEEYFLKREKAAREKYMASLPIDIKPDKNEIKNILKKHGFKSFRHYADYAAEQDVF